MASLRVAVFVAFVAYAGAVTLSGTVRSFTAASTDFSSASTSLDRGVAFVSSTLSANRKPVYVTGTSASVTQGQFDAWFNTPFSSLNANPPQAFAIDAVLTGSVYQFSATNWQPFGGSLFTFEISTYASFTSPLPTLTFGATCEMLVFVNGTLVYSQTGLGGTMTTGNAALPGTLVGQTVPINIFFTHRTSGAQPNIQIQLPAPSGCNARTSNIQVLDVYPFTVTNMVPIGTGYTVDLTGNTNLRVTSASTPNVGACGWNSQRFRITNGLVSTFTFQISGAVGGAQGFAFVLSGPGPLGGVPDRGGAGSTLAYNIANTPSIAVEFDMFQDTFDPNPNHIQVHTKYGSLTNDANNATITPSAPFTLASTATVNMSSGTAYDVRIEYLPLPAGLGGNAIFEVYIGNTLQTRVPVNLASINAMFGGLAYVGFCGSTSNVAANTDISNWRVFQTPVSALNTVRTPRLNWPVITAKNLILGVTPDVDLKSVDGCGTDVILGGATVGLTLRKSPSGTVISGQVTRWQDLNANASTVGWYSVWLGHNLTENVTLTITINNQQIAGSPFALQVVAAPVVGITSSFTCSVNCTLWVAGVQQTLTVTARDQFGNLNLEGGKAFTVRFSTSANVTHLPNGASANSTYVFTPSETQAADAASLFVRVNGNDDVGGGVTAIRIIAAAPYGPKSSLSGPGLYQGTKAGTIGTIYIAPLDQYDNPIIIPDPNPSATVTVSFTGRTNSTAIVTTTVTWQSGGYMIQFNGTVAQLYSLDIRLNGSQAQSVTSYSPQIIPNDTNSPGSTLLLIAPGNVTATPNPSYGAGIVSTFYIQAVDGFGNTIKIPTLSSIGYFTVSLQGPTGVQTAPASCATGAAVSSIDITFLNCTYNTGGSYAFNFVGVTFGGFIVTANFVPVSGPSKPVRDSWGVLNPNLTITAGQASPYTSSVSAFPSTIVAGHKSSIAITARDAYNNVRTAANDANLFVTTITSGPYSVIVGTEAGFIAYEEPTTTNSSFNMTLAGVSGVYTQWILGMQAGVYTLECKLLGTPIVNSNVSITVLPGEIWGLSSVFMSDGNTTGQNGGVGGTSTSFILQTMDFYGNNQTNTSGSYAVDINGTAATSIVPVSGQPGRFTVTYSVPAFVPMTSNTFNISVIWTPTAGAPQPALMRLAYIQPGAATPSYAKASGPALSNGQAGVDEMFIITPYIDNTTIGGFLQTDTFQVSFAHTDGVTIVQAKGVVADNVTNIWNVTYQCTKMGRYRVFIRKDGLETYQSQDFLSLPANYLTIGHGPLDANRTLIVGLPAVVTAGVAGNFTIRLSDRFGNLFDTESSPVEVITGYVAWKGNPPNNNTPPFTNAQGGPVVGVSNRDGTFNVSFLTTLATIPVGGPSPYVYSLGAFAQQLPGLYLSGTYYDLIVNPDVADPTQSLITNLPLPPFVAGQQGLVTYEPKDRFGNRISGSSLQFSVNLQLNPGLSVSTQLASFGVFSLLLTPTVSSTISDLSFMVMDGVRPASPSYNVTVNPADPDYAMSNYTGPATVLAGTDTGFTLTLKDRFGNNWLDNLALVSVRVLLAPFPAITATLTSMGTGTGAFNVSFVPLKKSPPNYTFSVLVETNSGGVFLPFTNVLLVRPNVVYPPFTLIPPIPQNNLPAGSWANVTLWLRDRYGPNTQESGGSNVTLRWVVGQPACQPSGQPDFSTENAALFGNRMPVDNGDGSYTINISTTKAGDYFVWVIVDDVAAQPCNSIPLTFRVNPLDPHPPNTDVSCVGCTDPNNLFIIAGDWSTINFKLRDIYWNDVNRAGYPIRVGDPSDFARECLGTDPPPFGLNGSHMDPANNNISEALYNDTMPGSFRLYFQQTKAQLFTLLIDILVPGASNYQRIGNSSCPRLEVRNSWPYFFNKTTSATVLIAAKPSTFDIYAEDEYQNPVLYGYHTFSTELQRRVATGDNVNYILFVTTSPVQGVATQRVEVNPAWAGDYDVTIRLNQEPKYILKQPAVSSVSYVVSVTAATCDEETMAVGTPYRCEVGRVCSNSYQNCSGLVSTPTSFGCSGGSVCNAPGSQGQCASSGSCPTFSANQCPLWAPNLCPSPHGGCVANTSDCNSNHICPTGFAKCPDGRSCVRSSGSAADCFAPPPCSAFLCPNGACVSTAADCGTEITCPPGQSLCGDGSCQANEDSCPDVYICSDLSVTPVRCIDGSCRRNASDCPSSVVCPLGMMKCPNGRCALSWAECENTTWTVICPLAMTRCPDGSCAHNLLLCGTARGCPSWAPTLCADRSCARTQSECSAMAIETHWCPSTAPVYCPSGTCARTTSECPTPIRCPENRNVMCPDGSCQMSLDQCPAWTPCPFHAPVRCPDFTCRGSRKECPSLVLCPPQAPVRCPDMSCAAADTMCAPIDIMDCPNTTVRCPDGACAMSFADCPTSVTCGDNYQRCADGMCRFNCSDAMYSGAGGKMVCANKVVCGPGLFSYPSLAQAADMPNWCANYSWQCPQGMTCPRDKPVRCTDQSCQRSADECPVLVTDTPANRIPCPGNLFSSSVLVPCGSSPTCPMNLPVKCWDETCRLVAEDCPPMVGCETQGYIRCSDGSCATDIFGCTTTPSCPTSDALFTCFAHDSGDNGCVSDPALCPDPTNVLSAPNMTFCPGSQVRCPNGACVAISTDCNRNKITCPYFLPVRCSDGSCQKASTDCPTTQRANSPCVNPTPFRCDDGTCAVSADSCQQCPGVRPFKCADGFCAVSSRACPIMPGMPACPAASPIRCLDGVCRKSSYQCPSIVPCFPPTGRCGNGTCSSGCVNASMGDTCGTGFWRCPNGLCAPQGGSCADDMTGCPNGTTKCPNNGYCAGNSTPCSQWDLPANGCPMGTPKKCPNGLCVSMAAPCPAPALAAIGTNCTASQVRCGDGTCGTASSCMASNGCASATPIRCADGSCKAHPAQLTVEDPAACSAVVVCSSLRPFRCANGECVAHKGYCRPLHDCPNSMVLCPDLSCASSASACSNLTSVCPAASPALCPDGSCRASSLECERWKTSFDAYSMCRPSQTRCYDGACVARPLDCIMKQFLQTNPTGTWNADANLNTGVCPSTLILCGDGSCVKNRDLCPVMPRCPDAMPFRCGDSSCTVNGTCPSVGVCPATTVRCVDGTCRQAASCPLFDGCSVGMFYCGGQKDFCKPTAAACASETQKVCKTNCRRDIQALYSATRVPLSEDVTVEVAYSEDHVSRTSLTLPAGSLGAVSGNQWVKIRPVPTSGKPASFFERLLSPPFTCETSSPLTLDAKAQASVDMTKYATNFGPVIPDPHAGMVKFPCKMQGTFNGYATVDLQTDQCRARRATVNDISAFFSFPACASWPGMSMGLIVNSVVVKPGSVPRYEMWFNVTSGPTDPPLAVGAKICMLWSQGTSPDKVTVYYNYQNASICPTRKEAGVRTFELDLVQTGGLSACDIEESQKASSPIEYEDICLATYTPGSPGVWTCAKNTYELRNESMDKFGHPWNSRSDRSQDRVEGAVTSCNGNTIYGFAYIPLVKPAFKPKQKTFFAQWGGLIIGLIVGFTLFCLIASYVIWRLARYRDKYKQETKHLQQLEDEARALDMNAGGLGIADDEVRMVANPLVLEMRELEERITKVNKELEVQSQNEANEIDALEVERAKLYAKIQQVKQEMAKNEALNEANKKQPKTAAAASVAPAFGAPAGGGDMDFSGAAAPRKKKD